eukprot:157623_1
MSTCEFIIATCIVKLLHISRAADYNITTQHAFLYAGQGQWPDTNTRPSYTQITLKDETIANTNPSSYYMKPDDSRGFNLELNLFVPFTFHPTQITSITFEIAGSTTIGQVSEPCELIVIFSQTDSKYISTSISIDEQHDNLIYPNCDTSFPYTQPLAYGDIYQTVSQWNNEFNDCRICKAFGMNLETDEIYNNSRFQPPYTNTNISYP